MKKLFLFLFVLGSTFSCRTTENVFILDGNQSMLMYGKGEGQDAAINPYEGRDCQAVVKNLSKSEISVRIQDKKGKYQSYPVKPGQREVIDLPKGYEIYLDSETAGEVYLKFKK